MATDPLKLDTLVELLDHYSDVYPLSPTGARGWVRARRELPKADAEVYIEWDKKHWRYHGERDGWTFEHHFQVVDDTVPESPDPGIDRILEAVNQRAEDERCPHCGEINTPEEDHFLDTLDEAQDQALKSDGFFVMTLTPETKDGLVIYEPSIHTACLTPLAQELLRTQLLYLAAQIYQDDVSLRMRGMRGHDEPE